jgi:hypothetical protein
MLAVATLVCAGCASGSPQMGAKSFYEEHAKDSAGIAATTRAVELAIPHLTALPTPSQRRMLAADASQAHARLMQVGAWKVAGQGEEGAEEEDVPRAETQVAEGAEQLAAAMSSLGSYVLLPKGVTLAKYRSELASGRTSWNEGISQLWYLAHERMPPKL